MNQYKYALIGCGRISANHIAAVKTHSDRLELVALCDIDETAIERIKEKIDVTTDIMIFTDYKEMLSSIKLDIVAIATESDKHAEIAIDCMNSGINVIVEKPMALSLSDADQMIETSERMGVKLCISHQNRFNKSIRRIREGVENGEFGKVLHGSANIRWNRGQEYYKQAKWRGTWKQDGGALMNQCIHNIDLLRWMMGDDIDEVCAYTDRKAHSYIEGEDIGISIVKFSNGGLGVIEGTTYVYPRNLEETLYLFGEEGTVKAGGKSVNIIEEWLSAKMDQNECDRIKDEFSETPPNIYGYGHTPLYSNFIDALDNDGKPLIDGYAGRRAIELVLAIYKSSLDGKPVKLPLSNFSTLDMNGIW